MRNYHRGEVALTPVGLFRLTEDSECGSHWLTAETMTDPHEPCKIRESEIIVILEPHHVP